MIQTSRGFVLINVYDTGYCSKMVFKVLLNGDVDAFIITQHIFKSIDSTHSIKFDDLYEAVKYTIKHDNRQMTINDGYDTFIFCGYDSHNHVVENDKYDREFRLIEIWEDSMYPFNIYNVNGEILLDNTNIFSKMLEKRIVANYVINEMKCSKPNLSYQEEVLIRHDLGVLMDLKEHFKFKDYEISKMTITRLDQLNKLGF